MKTRCETCGRFARRSIIGTICVACIARQAGFRNVAEWAEAMQRQIDAALVEYERKWTP